jgi:hypothetical protein
MLQDSVLGLVQNKRWTKAVAAFEDQCNKRWRNGCPWAASVGDVEAMHLQLKKLSHMLPAAAHATTLRNIFKGGVKAKTHDFFVIAGSIGMLMQIYHECLRLTCASSC